MIRQLEDEFFAPLDPETRKAFHELLLRLAAHNDPRCAFSSPLVSALTAEAGPAESRDVGRAGRARRVRQRSAAIVRLE